MKAAIFTLSDHQLDAALAEELAKLKPKAHSFALATTSGKPGAVAARELGMSGHPRQVLELNRATAKAQALLRERARRKATVTAEETALWFEAVAAEALRSKDRGAAIRARTEAARLRGLYPDVRLKLEVEHEVKLAEVSAEEWARLAALRHELRRREIDVTPRAALPLAAPGETVPGFVPDAREAPLSQARGGDPESPRAAEPRETTFGGPDVA